MPCSQGRPRGIYRSSRDFEKPPGQYNESAYETKEELSIIKHTPRFGVDLTVKEGKFGNDFAHTKGTGALGYDCCLSSDRRRCRILET
jgi:hypothetical protein